MSGWWDATTGGGGRNDVQYDLQLRRDNDSQGKIEGEGRQEYEVSSE